MQKFLWNWFLIVLSLTNYINVESGKIFAQFQYTHKQLRVCIYIRIYICVSVCVCVCVCDEKNQ